MRGRVQERYRRQRPHRLRCDQGGKPAAPPHKEKQARPQISLLSKLREHPYIVIAVAIIVLIAAAGVLIWWLNARHYESTDDAFIDARTVSISAQINGAIVEVPADDNQDVQAGAVLARIDERDYRAAVDQAKAQVDQAVAGIANLDAQVEAQQARIEEAEKQYQQGQQSHLHRGLPGRKTAGARSCPLLTPADRWLRYTYSWIISERACFLRSITALRLPRFRSWNAADSPAICGGMWRR